MAKWMSIKTNSSSASNRQLMSFEMQKSSNCSTKVGLLAC